MGKRTIHQSLWKCGRRSGYGVWIGLEDNLRYDQKRTKRAKNIDLVDRVHRLASGHQRRAVASRKFAKMGFYNEHSPSEGAEVKSSSLTQLKHL